MATPWLPSRQRRPHWSWLAVGALCVVVILVAAIAGVRLVTSSHHPSSGPPRVRIAFKPFSDANVGFQCELPADWALDRYTAPDGRPFVVASTLPSDNVYAAQAEGALPAFEPQDAVVLFSREAVDPATANPLSLATAWAHDLQAHPPQPGTSVTILQPAGALQVGGRGAGGAKVQLANVDGIFYMSVVYIATSDPNHVFLVRSLAPQSIWDQSVVDHVVGSVALE